jgi:hypothetical protein
MTHGHPLEEQQVVGIIDRKRAGWTNIEIADDLRIGRKTVEYVIKKHGTRRPVVSTWLRSTVYRPNLSWMDQAACLPYAGVFDNEKRMTVEDARAVCARCPVTAACEAWGHQVAYVGRPDEGPVWAGKTGRELADERQEDAA